MPSRSHVRAFLPVVHPGVVFAFPAFDQYFHQRCGIEDTECVIVAELGFVVFIAIIDESSVDEGCPFVAFAKAWLIATPLRDGRTFRVVCCQVFIGVCLTIAKPHSVQRSNPRRLQIVHSGRGHFLSCKTLATFRQICTLFNLGSLSFPGCKDGVRALHTLLTGRTRGD